MLSSVVVQASIFCRTAGRRNEPQTIGRRICLLTGRNTFFRMPSISVYRMLDESKGIRNWDTPGDFLDGLEVLLRLGETTTDENASVRFCVKNFRLRSPKK